MIQPERIRHLNARPIGRGRFVLYWMQASVRANWNHALEYAIQSANRLDCPLIAGFGLTADFPEANARHYTFLLEGLRDAARALARRGIPLIVRRGSPDRVAVELARGAALVVTDRGYLRIQREWRARAADEVRCALIQVEGDVVVPVETASDHEAYSAGTLRPRIHAHLPRFLVPLRATRLRSAAPGRLPESLDLDDIPRQVRDLGVDAGVAPAPGFRGGAGEAARRLGRFLRHGLRRYHDDRNDPGLEGQSDLSPYLHFGHISPLQIAIAVKRSARGPAVQAYLEELIVRRELSMNFTHYHPNYDRYECLPGWARATLDAHARDPRPERYTAAELEAARTGDRYWNAAQSEMVRTGKMHGYMRMYWGKKILEWLPSPAEAFAVALALNNRYQLDGRDPNSFAGVAWCFGKHDRPWSERPIFGMVRYMNAAGLRRKFDIEAYVRRVEALRVAAGAVPPTRAGSGSGVR
jgi:deoxyribodipyrimidine photo-lyase